MKFDRVLVKAVTKVYGRQRALGGVNLELRAGRLCALLGPNGAGKSTLLSILSTLARPTGGEVLYGETPHLDAGRTLRGSIGLVAHESFLYPDLSGRENLRFFEGLYHCRGRVEPLLKRVGLEDAADRPVRTYSRGMQQRLALARALVPEPSLLLLDEPFTGLDRDGIDALRDLLRELRAAGSILLLVTHDFQAAANLCDHVVILRRGKIAMDQTNGEPYRDLSEVYTAHA